jgi:hypothetical protein
VRVRIVVYGSTRLNRFFLNSGDGKNLFLADFLVYRDTRSIYKLLKSNKCEGDCALTRTLPKNYFSKQLFKFVSKFFCGNIFELRRPQSNLSGDLEGHRTTVSQEDLALFSVVGDDGRWHL